MTEEATQRYNLCAVINSSNSGSCYNFVAMDSLIKASDGFEASISQKKINQEVFMEFMDKIIIQDYNAITRDHYLALSDYEKEKMVREYYSEVKCRSIGGKNIFFSFFSLV